MGNIKNMQWSKWLKFPNPEKEEYLTAPFGCGVYQLRNSKTGEFVLFGRFNNTAFRMSYLLPKPYGVGNRNKADKRNYVWKNIEDIEYRTMPCIDRNELICIESQIKRSQKNISLILRNDRFRRIYPTERTA